MSDVAAALDKAVKVSSKPCCHLKRQHLSAALLQALQPLELRHEQHERAQEGSNLQLQNCRLQMSWLWLAVLGRSSERCQGFCNGPTGYSSSET